MRRKKLTVAALALAVIIVTLLTQGTLAYYVSVGTAVNVITSGDVQMRIIEKMGDGEFPGDGVYILPGSIVSKKVSVANTGEHPFWLRVKLTDGMDDERLSPDVYELDLNLRDWIAADDGFYYYNKPLQPGAETEKLFTQVKIAGAVDNSYMGKKLSVTVSAYAVQSEYNEADSPLDVVGWPSESGGGL